MRPQLEVLDEPAVAACERLAAASGHVVLTGGSTPRSAYERVARRRADWSDAELWFSDERCVAPDHEHSNYRMVEAALLSRVKAPSVHRMRGELGPDDGAADYERELAEAFGEELPAFDLVLVGMGADAHFCSLFPGDAALGERRRLAVGVRTPGMAPLVPRITLTLPVVNAAKEIVFLVTGEEKAEAVARSFAGLPDPRFPASLVAGPVTVLLDRAAASRLDAAG
jgi:6-phosphogluconolactonase